MFVTAGAEIKRADRRRRDESCPVRLRSFGFSPQPTCHASDWRGTVTRKAGIAPEDDHGSTLMTVQSQDHRAAPGQAGQAESSPTEAHDRVEADRLANRRRHTWRVILALAMSVVLLLLALGFRRDQVRRQVALDDLGRLAAFLDRWVQQQAALPARLPAVVSAGDAKFIEQFEYAPLEKRRLALKGQRPVVLICSRQPMDLTLSPSGRAVLLCRRTAFQVKWMSETEVAAQRRNEDRRLAKDRDSGYIRANP